MDNIRKLFLDYFNIDLASEEAACHFCRADCGGSSCHSCKNNCGPYGITKEKKSLIEALSIANQLDLSKIELRLKIKNNWDSNKISTIVDYYRKYLALVITTGENISPTLDIDEVWHAHILHTKQYIEDCDKLGSFIHHEPL